MEVCYIEPKHSSTWSKNPTIWHCWAASQFSVISCHTVLLSVPRFCICTNLNGCLYRVSISWRDTKCYDTFWGNWKFLVVDCFLFMRKLHDAWVCRIFYSQSICVYWYCDCILSLCEGCTEGHEQCVITNKCQEILQYKIYDDYFHSLSHTRMKIMSLASITWPYKVRQI